MSRLPPAPCTGGEDAAPLSVCFWVMTGISHLICLIFALQCFTTPLLQRSIHPSFQVLAFSLWLIPPPSPKTLSESWVRRPVSSCGVPPALPLRYPPIHSHPPLPIINPSLPLLRTRNARVHSRLNEVNIAGMQPYVIAGPTPTKTKGCLFKWGATKDHWGISMCRGRRKRSGTRGGRGVVKWITPLNHGAG